MSTPEPQVIRVEPKEPPRPVERIPCPFVYAKGKHCTGEITHVEAYKADLSWSRNKKTGEWTLGTGQPRSHYHLFCSEKGNHAGSLRPDSAQMKCYYDQLPEAVQKLIGSNEYRPIHG